MGAQAVLVARPYLWDLAVDGEAGVRRALQLLLDDLRLSMALAGCPNIGSITPNLITRV